MGNKIQNKCNVVRNVELRKVCTAVREGELSPDAVNHLLKRGAKLQGVYLTSSDKQKLGWAIMQADVEGRNKAEYEAMQAKAEEQLAQVTATEDK